MGKYVYPAIIEHAKDGYNVSFPDLSGCYTCGEDLADAIAMAEDVLALWLFDLEERNEEVAKPSDPKNIACGKNEVVTLICCDTLEYQKMYHTAAVKKTLSVPGWLNYAAEKANINFSQVLQDALRTTLGVN